MIELEIYALGIRNLDKILALDRALEGIVGLRYKVDSNHDIVYFEAEHASLTIDEVCAIFRRLELEPRVVGAVPEAMKASKKKTQQIFLDSSSP